MNPAHTLTQSFSATPARASFLALAAAVTFGLLGTMAAIADHQVADVQMAQSAGTQTQVVVITGHRLPRA
jgi:hypothetical protein